MGNRLRCQTRPPETIISECCNSDRAPLSPVFNSRRHPSFTATRRAKAVARPDPLDTGRSCRELPGRYGRGRRRQPRCAAEHGMSRHHLLALLCRPVLLRNWLDQLVSSRGKAECRRPSGRPSYGGRVDKLPASACASGGFGAVALLKPVFFPVNAIKRGGGGFAGDSTGVAAPCPSFRNWLTGWRARCWRCAGQWRWSRRGRPMGSWASTVSCPSRRCHSQHLGHPAHTLAIHIYDGVVCTLAAVALLINFRHRLSLFRPCLQTSAPTPPTSQTTP